MSRDKFFDALWELVKNTDVDFEECDFFDDEDVVYVMFKGVTQPDD